jgi:hypothetical protein
MGFLAEIRQSTWLYRRISANNRRNFGGWKWGEEMRPEAKEQLLANLDESARALGGTSIQDGIVLARRILAKLVEIMDTVQSREQLVKALDDWNVLPELESLMIQGAADAPRILRWMAMNTNKAANASLPSLPKGRPAVPAQKQVEIVEFVKDLYVQHGVQLEDAKRRAAKRCRCSIRTVERCWRDRRRILKDGPKYHFYELLSRLITVIMADFEAETAAQSQGADAPASEASHRSTRSSAS